MEDTHRIITTRLILNSLSDEITLPFSFRQGVPISCILVHDLCGTTPSKAKGASEWVYDAKF